MKIIEQSKMGSYICVVLLTVLLLTQFLPFWSCNDCRSHREEDKSISIAEYTWFPEEHSPITKGMTDVYKEAYGEDYKDENGKNFRFRANDIVNPLIIIFFGCISGIVLCLLFAKHIYLTLIPLIVGGYASYWYLTNPAMQAGQHWVLHLVVAVLTAVAALAVLALNVKRKLRKRN